MKLNVVPLSIVDKAWAKELDVQVAPVLSAMSALVFDRRLGSRPLCVSLPESMGRVVDAAGSFRYVAGQNWRVSSDGNWSYVGTSLQQFGGNAHYIQVPHELYAKVAQTATESATKKDAVEASDRKSLSDKYPRQDSNLQPSASEADALSS